MRTGPGIQPDGAGALFVVGVDGGRPVRITPWGASFLDCAWSPDGEWIVFQRPYGQLFLVHPDGSGLHRIPLELPQGAGARTPSWSPDGQWIVFSMYQARGATIWAVRPDGSDQQQVTRRPPVSTRRRRIGEPDACSSRTSVEASRQAKIRGLDGPVECEVGGAGRAVQRVRAIDTPEATHFRYRVRH